jgi:uncharacterized protein YpuA (DUF1002 family)
MKRTGVNRKSIKSRQRKIDLQPVVARMDKFDARMNRFDKKIDSIRQEFKKSRRETKQEIRSVRKDMAKYYFAAREENRIIADEHARTLTKIFTTMDGMAKDYSR